jgi:diaminohydroxyphosphoribosylaminopyrimidine deaminase/5-amino-6-(5-phosphoribosylamino)uracil reductase
MKTNDGEFMKLALELAERGRGWTSPNPMVGALVVKEGQIVGRGFHRAAGMPHAEVEAIEDAGAAAGGATLYVTLEPCNHHGRTPPCTEKILAAGIRRVVAAMEDPNPNVAGGGADRLKTAGVEVAVGLCRDEALRQNEAFVKYVLRRRPFTAVKCAATLDGRLATRTGDSKWITGERSRAFVHRLRHGMDAILVGIGTVAADDPSLTARPGSDFGPARDPIRLVLDSRLSISPSARVLHLDSPSETYIICGVSAPENRRKAIEKAGARILEMPAAGGKIALDPLMEALGAMGITSLLIEGGGRVLGSAFREGIVDRVYFFYGPKIYGGDDGVPVCSGEGPARLNDAVAIRNVRVHRFDDDVMIEGDVHG